MAMFFMQFSKIEKQKRNFLALGVRGENTAHGGA